VSDDPYRRLLVVVAHPDDETFGLGSVIALEAARGVEVVVCCATAGENGEAPEWLADADLGEVRRGELRAAATELGVRRVELLDFGDSGMTGEPPPRSLAGAPFEEVVAVVGAVVDEVGPDVVVTLDPVGGDGHRDHARIGAATIEACRERTWTRVYAWTVPRPLIARWFAELERLRPGTTHLELDLDRAGLGRPDGDITTVLDTSTVLDVRTRAIALHRSQTPPFHDMPDDLRHAFLTRDHLVRVQPPWDGDPVERRLL
jgi:LmbE family N-acetylglucosaminyl deacetylase